MKMQAKWQEIREHRYMPQYRLPRFMSCFLLVFFLGIVTMGLLIFLGGPMLLSYLGSIDTSPTAPILRLQLGTELRQGDLRLLWQTVEADGTGGYRLEFERINLDSSTQTFSFYYMPGLTEVWALPDAGYLRLHHLQDETLELQWILEGS